MLPPGAQHSDEKGAKEVILDDDECPLQIFREWPYCYLWLSLLYLNLFNFNYSEIQLY